METNNMNMEELMEMNNSVECSDRRKDKNDKCPNCGKVNIFTKNVYLDINCCSNRH
ncbi:hypothetical protein K144316041_13950 [Clostridium tetani]|uniref:hypothetical protein n=1 Tax=Clostridium tetani TaxID=1513 RepID=UPI0029552588|nr:hypothetical protein [Clostridium tetani]BDR72687.1 hypothetical protein K144316041_13950 [Clostridium tetani]